MSRTPTNQYKILLAPSIPINRGKIPNHSIRTNQQILDRMIPTRRRETRSSILRTSLYSRHDAEQYSGRCLAATERAISEASGSFLSKAESDSLGASSRSGCHFSVMPSRLLST
jgi:hypothetical protein